MWIKLIIISLFSGTIAGMGIGGGSIFILLSTIFDLFEHKQAQSYNLVMFIAVGISATIFNLKNKNVDKSLLKELIIPVCIGSIIGIELIKYISDKTLKNSFYFFMVIIGIYEIISSLKSIFRAKNNSVERS